MLRQLGIALSGLCLVSTMAIAQQMPAPGMEMVCTKVDAMGNCIEAKGTDEKMVVVKGEKIKVGEKMKCVMKDGTTTCTKVTMVR
jgi:hypothetical protein